MDINVKTRKAKFTKKEREQGLALWDSYGLELKALIYLIKLDFERNGNLIDPEAHHSDSYYNPRLLSILFAALYRTKELPESRFIRNHFCPAFVIIPFYEVPGKSDLQPYWRLKDKNLNWDEIKFRKAKAFLHLGNIHNMGIFRYSTDDLIWTAMTMSEADFEKALPEKLRKELEQTLAEDSDNSLNVKLSKLLVSIDVKAQFAETDWNKTPYRLFHRQLDKCYESLTSMAQNEYIDKITFAGLHKPLFETFWGAFCIPYVKLDNIVCKDFPTAAILAVVLSKDDE